MLLTDITDQILSSISGGIRTDDSKFAEMRVEAKVHVWRQRALTLLYNGSDKMAGNKFIGSLNYQQFDVNYDSTIQDRSVDYIIFAVPEAVQLNRFNNGFIFLGNKKAGVNFTQLKSPDYYSNAKASELISPTKVYWYRSGELYIKVWGNTNLKTLYVDGVIGNPLLVPGFDPEAHDYPASQEVLDLIFNFAYAELNPQYNTVIDPINDQKATIDAKKFDPINA